MFPRNDEGGITTPDKPACDDGICNGNVNYFNILSYILLIIIRFYQYFISPWLGSNCRFTPTCSEYAKEAIIIYGAFKGGMLAFKRILRCQPFCDGGYDPVPKEKK